MSETDRLQRAIELLSGLMEWAPDDLDEEPTEWAEAREFLEKNNA